MVMPMRLPLQLLLAVLAVSTAFPLNIATRDGKTYKHAKVTGVYSDGLSITRSSGVIKVPFDNLSDAIQKDYSYDPAKAAEEAKKAEAARAAAAQHERERIALQADEHRRQQESQKLSKTCAGSLRHAAREARRVATRRITKGKQQYDSTGRFIMRVITEWTNSIGILL
jgi:hypothetical protein